MPKKSKRQFRREAPASTPAAIKSSNGSTTTTTSSSSRSTEFNPNYSYIIKDLRRIGILAGSFFVILIALSFILPILLHY